MTEYPQNMKIENYLRFIKKKLYRKIEQQKLLKEAPPNLVYSVFGFSLVRTSHAGRKGG